MLECTARMLGLKALQPCYCTNTSARQGCHQQSAVFAARESCSLVNAAWVHVVRLGIHNWLHSVKVWCIFWGGRCRWGPQVVGLCDVSFAPFYQQAAPHTPELHGQRAQKKRTSEESHRPCTCEPRCHRGGAEWAGRQQVPERKRTKGGGHSSRGPTASAASGSQTSRNIPPAPMQHCRIRNAARNHTGHCAGC